MLSKLSHNLYVRLDCMTLMARTDTTKKFQIAKALAAQEYFSIISPYIEIIQKTDQEFKGEITKKRVRQK